MSTQLKKVLYTFYIVVALVLISCESSDQRQGLEAFKVEHSFEEKLLTTIPENLALQDFNNHVFSPDGKNVAYIAQKGGKQFVIVGEDRGEMFDSVGFPIFSPDGKTVVYIAQQEKKKLVIFGKEKGELFDNVWSLLFSPDSKTFGYLAQQDGKAFAVVGGEKSEAFDRVESLVFRPDGKEFAYSAKSGKKWRVVVGKEKGPEYISVGLNSNAFSPDGKTLGYVAKEGNKWFAVIGGDRGPEFDSMGSNSLVFSIDGTAAYNGKKNNKWYTVVGSKMSKPFDATWSPIFSPDGKTAAFVAREGKKKFVVVGDKAESLQFDEMWSNSPVFSPNGKKVAYNAKEGESWYAVLGKEKSTPYDRVENVVFSPDSKTIAYFAKQGGKWYIINDDKKSEAYDGIIVSNLYVSSIKLSIKRTPTLIFSPSGKRVASVGLRGNKAFVAAGDNISAGYDLIGGMPACLSGQVAIKQIGEKVSFYSQLSANVSVGQRTRVTGCQLITFSPDGSKVAFGGRDGRELWWKVLKLN